MTETKAQMKERLREAGILVELGCGCRFVKDKSTDTNLDAITNRYTKMCPTHQREVDSALADIAKGWKPVELANGPKEFP